MPIISITIERLNELKRHFDEGDMMLHITSVELFELNEYRRRLGIGDHTINEALRDMIEKKNKKLQEAL
jgi:hypothetical protein